MLDQPVQATLGCVQLRMRQWHPRDVLAEARRQLPELCAQVRVAGDLPGEAQTGQQHAVQDVVERARVIDARQVGAE